MSQYVLDTHTVVYALSSPKKLGRKAAAALKRVECGKERAWIPAAVVSEICILRELSRIEFGLPELKGLWETPGPISFLPLDLNQLDIFSTLAHIRDPFDRLIVSAARSVSAKLISKDRMLTHSAIVKTLWS